MNISVTLETLSSGNLRATGRHDSATVFWRDGNDAKALVSEALRQTAPAHRLPDGTWDLRYIATNGAAAQVIDAMEHEGRAE